MSDPYLEELTRRNKELAAAQAPAATPEVTEDMVKRAVDSFEVEWERPHTDVQSVLQAVLRAALEGGEKP